jgi:hypothetical protein
MSALIVSEIVFYTKSYKLSHLMKVNLILYILSDLWIHHHETKLLCEELHRFETREEDNEDEGSEGESTDDELQQAEVLQKGDNSSESGEESSEEGGQFASGKNPFAALAGDD